MSILTKEGIQKILNDDWLLMDDCEGLENCTVIKELARMALAAMDSEPVAESVTCWSCKKVVEVSAIGDCDGYCPECDAPIDLDEEPYTSEHPVPVVPDERDKTVDADDHPLLWSFNEGWNACRAAMLSGGKS
ncbi:TPA: hypothetical protein ACXGFC_002359 [Klebsiella pneumoniae]